MLKVPVTKATLADHIGFQVDTFCETVAMPTVDVVQNTFPPVIECFDEGFEWLETTCFYSLYLDPQSSFGGLTISNAIEKVTEFLFQLVTGLELWRSRQHSGERFCFACSSLVRLSRFLSSIQRQPFKHSLVV
jgi:hypothetical protein